LFSRAGSGNYEVDFIDRQGGVNVQVPGARGGVPFAGTPGAQTATGLIFPGTLGPNTAVSSVTQDLLFGWDNTNDAGVSGGTGAADQVAAAAVTTGMEFSIHLDDLGDPAPGSEIKIAAFYASSNVDYISNQSLPAFTPPQHNLGSDGSNPGEGGVPGAFIAGTMVADFNDFTGTQYFTLIVPQPADEDGDYNDDGIVDAADYTIYRKTVGTNADLPNDPNPVPVGDDQYDTWVEHFADGGGGSGGGAVPEPGTMILAAVAACFALSFGRRR
jgi:hypothetical protein